MSWSLTNKSAPPWLAPLAIGFLATVVSACLTIISPPQPKVHDEFSYLLSADTFASGRATNATHAFGDHFESIHVIQRPSYASKYQPGPGLVMAAGQRLTGHPIVGVWLSTGMAAAGLCWMLCGWLPRRWAITGGLLAVMHIGMQSEWGHSFWGGALPFLGGTLVLGATSRWVRKRRITSGFTTGFGAGILTTTRPFEGAMLCGVVGVYLLATHLRRRGSWRSFLTTLIAPVGLTVAVFLTALGFYNHQVTGSAVVMPYQIHEQTYAASPLFLWDAPQKPEPHRHASLRDYYLGWGMENYQRQQSFSGWLSDNWKGCLAVWKFYFGLALSIPLVSILYLLRRKRLRIVWAMLLVCLGTTLVVPWTMAHYIAPFAPLLFVLLVDGLRYLGTLRRTHRFGQLAVPAIVFLNVGLFAFSAYALGNEEPDLWHTARADMEADLTKRDRDQLVIVKYDASHNPHCEWVYNRADIDAAPVVWARSMDDDADSKLRQYFVNRDAWLLEPDAVPPRMTRLPH